MRRLLCALAAFLVAAQAYAGPLGMLGAGHAPGGAAAASTTLNPADCSADNQLSPGNLKITNIDFGDAFRNCRSIASVTTGLYYVEVTNNGTSPTGVGLIITDGSLSLTVNPFGVTNAIGSLSNGNTIQSNGGTVGAITSAWDGSGLGIDMALDATHRSIWYRNRGGLWNNSGTADPATNTGGIALPTALVTGSPPLFVMLTTFFHSPGDQITVNFGATAFVDTPPAGSGHFH